MAQEMVQVLDLPDEAATERLGADIALALRRGDVLALSGPLGAGKTTLARAALRTLARDPDLEVPSPTFTLCHTYALPTPLGTAAHLDFYRLADPSEAEELGLDEMVESGVVLVEWAERAPDALPRGTLRLSLGDASGGGRRATLAVADDRASEGDNLAARLTRSLAIRAFIDEAVGPGADRRFLQGDASSRRYETVHRPDLAGLVVMDAPRKPDGAPLEGHGLPYSRIAHLAEDVVPFVAIGETLREAGLAAPAILARSLDDGLLLVEHLGTDSIARGPEEPIESRYVEAARLLALMHGRPWPEAITVGEGGDARRHEVPRFDQRAFLIEVSLFADWFVPHGRGRPLEPRARARFDEVWRALFAAVDGSMPTLLLRDFHSPNLIWRDEPFPRSLGLIDFQDALIGPAAYDLASVSQDARVTVPEALERAMIERYCAERAGEPGFSRDRLEHDHAVLAAQRATKILGIFTRLKLRDGKGHYMVHMPRLHRYLARSLRHPALADFAGWLAETGLGEGLLDG